MSINRRGLSLFIPAAVLACLLVACSISFVLQTPTLAPSATPEPSLTAMLTETQVCDGLCPEDSMTATAAMAATLDAIPTNTPPAGAAMTPSAGDLGWGSVYGTIVDGVTGLPLEGATVRCEQTSYAPRYLCNGVTVTNSEGRYLFNEIFFHDTDRIILLVEAPGYIPLRFEQSSFTRAEFNADLGLWPVGYESPTPFVMCTPPACSEGALVCGDPNGCPGGCGTVCMMPSTPTP